MLPALKQIGDYALEKSKKGYIEQIIENPNNNGRYNTVLVILFEEKEDGIVFKDIKVEEFSREKLKKYAYGAGTSRGGDLTPTSKITKLESTFNRIQYPLKNTCEVLNNESSEAREIMGIYQQFQDEKLNKLIFERLKEIKYDGNAILTIGLKKEDSIKYVGDFAIFIEQLKEKYEEKFYFKKSYNKAEQKSIGKNNLCYICGEKAERTYGFVSTFTFYNLDKVGFTSGGFNRGEAWKNYPVCSKCAIILDQGRRYLEQNLSARFCGMDYFIIPKTIFGTDEESKEYMFETLESLEEKRKFSLKKENRDKLTLAEDDLFEIMQDFDNYLNYNLLFFRVENSAFRILLYVEDVLPSYIRRIFDVKRELEENPLYRGLKGKDGEIFNLNFTFNLIADFFPLTDYEKTFLEITNGVFSQKKISYMLLLNRFVDNLQERFRKGLAMSHNNIKALMILDFLMQLNLLQGRREGIVRMEIARDSYTQMIEDFFDNYSNFFDSDVKRALFLEGVLAQKLLNIQYKERDGATPFKARLNGLKINEKIAKRLLPEIQNKLDEYKKNYYRRLEEVISQYMLVADFSEISNTEMSFYFTTGMNLAGKFQFEKEDKNSQK